MYCKNCGKEAEEELCSECKNSSPMEHSIEDNVQSVNNKNKFFIKLILILIAIVFFIAISIYFLIPRISLKINKVYELDDFYKHAFKVKGSVTVKLDETIWNLNGYEIYKGKKAKSLPIVIGKNKLTIKNGELEKTYEFEVKNTKSKLVNSSEKFIIPFEYLDMDGDGIPNGVEKEKNLSLYSNDTDGDGLLDNVELVIGLDPTSKDDYNELRTYIVKQDYKKDSNIYVEVNGKGNVANTFLDTTELNIGFAGEFVQSDFVQLSTSNHEKPESMQIFFKENYKTDELVTKIYDYNPKTNEVNELDTKYGDSYFQADIDAFDHLYFLGNTKYKSNEYKNQIMILIDNSGSMFSPEYVNSKVDSKVEESDYKEYSNDVDFKRLSLMNALVDELGTEDYEYSINAFTNNYCDLIKASKDSSAIKAKINSLRTDCQVFNGTSVSGSILNYYKDFDYTTPGIKYMIVLTDGNDSTGIFGITGKLYSYNYNSIKKGGVKIITIGLGQGVNSSYLQEIARETNGKYLYASDANMLEELISIIKDSIQNQKQEVIDNKQVTLIADSGYDVKHDAFNFHNFSSKDSPDGNCYGFSYLSKQIYLNTFSYSDEYKKFPAVPEWDLIAYETTEKNKERLKKGKVYDISISKSLYEDVDNYKISLSEDEVNDNLKDDFQILQLINRTQRQQFHHLVDTIYERVNKQFKNGNYEMDINGIISELNQGAPALIGLLANVGGHTVLGTRIYRSNDFNEYILYIYDSNYPGQDMKAFITRQTPYEVNNGRTKYSFKYEYKNSDIVFTSLVYSGEN